MLAFDFRSATCGLSAGFLAISSIASDAQVAGSTTPQVWKLDWQRNHCVISTGDVGTAGLALKMTPGDPDPTIDVVGSPDLVPTASRIPDPPLTTFSVTLRPNGEKFRPLASELSSGGNPRVVELTHLYHEFPSAFANSSEFRLQSPQKLLSIPIVGASKAMAALQQCVDEKLAEWGVDVKSYRALRVPPTDIPDHPWISYEDYPEDAERAGATGQVIARVDVDATGKVTGCTVVVKARWQDFNELTCYRALQRGLYNPAIGADGHPTSAVRIEDIEFKLYG